MLTPGTTSRRQYVIMNGKVMLLWVDKGAKSYTDKTSSVTCKVIYFFILLKGLS